VFAPHSLHHKVIAYIWLIYPLGHVYAELELEVEAVQVEAITNLALDQGKP
jgi:hypothetical protein